jgi:hypothetical protein
MKMQKDSMELKLNRLQRLLLLLTPVIAISVNAPNPAQAATSASAEASVYLFDFSHNPFDVGAVTDKQTSIYAPDGQALAGAAAIAVFENDPDSPYAENKSLSQADGDGIVYHATADSFAGIVGYNFKVNAGEKFSFKFKTDLALKTAIDAPNLEVANASGNILFQLFDSTDKDNLIPLDEFSIFGFLNSLNDDDDLKVNDSKHVKFNPKKTSIKTAFGGEQESAIASTQGIFSREFKRSRTLTLYETKATKVAVRSVPEAGNVPSLLLAAVSFGMMGARGAIGRKKSPVPIA